MTAPLRLGLVGGAAPSMIGQVHRRGATMDNAFALVAGALSSDAGRGRAAAAEYGIAPDRAYASIEEMIAREAARPDGIEAVAIVTPNDLHHAQALAAIAAGLDVMLDKPIANSVAQAEQISRAAASRGVAVGVAHAYSGYPMIREARALVAAGRIGALRMVQVEYFGAGLAARVEEAPDASRRWRLDPARSGPSLVLGDIGTHAHHLACFVAGEPFAAISAEVGALMPGRVVQDYAQARFRLAGGARGSMVLCQGAAGAENHILLRVFGEHGHIEWRHAAHNELRLAPLDGFPMMLSRGHPMLSAAATRATRFRRTGHPEGLHEAFATLYLDLAAQAVARRRGVAPDPLALTLPGAQAGLDGLRFIEAALRSAAREGGWEAL
ncbi:Gfo/Idh/MocA family protein [Roseomonas sp. CECT 9278]|uniref:Gfo/Idh/MocA family protein n=1 Tax=Roseomonas sp. CECT 9278 TaxID=2845823 RepID=UPI001E54F7D5|nr:Gfo/Idh/MocA family oxidoreductase [Roseomonas sp. CECT 9278]CAH0259752.1 Inositol 2-dehydrogenase/D-chiro-inositol 3-dehydrogenase [Roseomonas sp. CECT 9278]